MSLVMHERAGRDGRRPAEGTALGRWQVELARAFDGLDNRPPGHPGSLA